LPALSTAFRAADVECITTDDTEQGFFFTNNIVEDLLNITSVHPIREEIIKPLFQIGESR